MSRARALAALAAGTCLAVSGCSDESSAESSAESSSSSSSDEDVCASADALRSSIGELDDVQVAENGTAALQEAVSEVGDDVEQLADEARREHTDQVGDVEVAFREVVTAVEELATSPSAAAVSDVGTALRTLGGDVAVLLDDVGSSC
ncbi:hypothetical protein [Blastococcus sp. SYSU D01042]